MKHRMMFLSLCILFACLIPQPCQPCTSFCLYHGNQLLFGSNLDWYLDDGLVIVNKRGVSKTAMTYINMDSNPTSWTSKYGSLTFNQYGREITFSGINEAGLVVSTMMLLETEYPAPDSRPSLGPGQWTQYQLDNSSTFEVFEPYFLIMFDARTNRSIELYSSGMGNLPCFQYWMESS